MKNTKYINDKTLEMMQKIMDIEKRTFSNALELAVEEYLKTARLRDWYFGSMQATETFKEILK